MSDATIQWYPGHMHKASREMRSIRSRVQVFIELLDARIPFSSANPMLDAIRGDKPVVRVLAKTDLADPAVTELWKAHFAGTGSETLQFVDARKRGSVAAVISACRKASTGKRKVTAMVVGIPNVGKSTLINTLAGRAVAKTGNEPAVTQRQQTVEIDPGLMLLDTPGVMWPKVENPNSGFRLAVTGAIRDTAMPYEEVGLFAVSFLAQSYPDRISERYRIDDPERPALEVLNEIGRRRGCLVKGGEVDVVRAAKVLVTDIREGRLGRISLETPQAMEMELADN